MQQGFQQLFLFGFAIQAKAREMLDKLKIPTTYVAMTPDVVMSDLLKTSRSSEIFSITGLPDVTLDPAGHKPDGTPLHQVEVKGLDIFRPDTMETDSIEAENLPCWMLDTNYNGMVFCASQVFFPKTGAWDNLQKSLKADFSDSVWEHLAGTVSEPFALGDKRRIAVKVIDDRGNELMVVKSAEGSEVMATAKRQEPPPITPAEVESPIINSPFVEPAIPLANRAGQAARQSAGPPPGELFLPCAGTCRARPQDQSAAGNVRGRKRRAGRPCRRQ